MIKDDNQNQNPYPYRLNDVWQAIGYSTMGHAKYALRQGFKESIDYILLTNDRKQNNENSGLDNRGGHNAETIYISDDFSR